MNSQEKSVLFALISESKGFGDGVAVYPFESTLKKLIPNSIDAKLTIYSLQQKEFITLGEKAGFDRMHKVPSMYPVYFVTTAGFEAALKAREEEIDINEKIQTGELDDIELPDFLDGESNHDDDL